MHNVIRYFVKSITVAIHKIKFVCEVVPDFLFHKEKIDRQIKLSSFCAPLKLVFGDFITKQWFSAEYTVRIMVSPVIKKARMN